MADEIERLFWLAKTNLIIRCWDFLNHKIIANYFKLVLFETYVKVNDEYHHYNYVNDVHFLTLIMHQSGL
jgi:hypothetical protein